MIPKQTIQAHLAALGEICDAHREYLWAEQTPDSGYENDLKLAQIAEANAYYALKAAYQALDFLKQINN